MIKKDSRVTFHYTLKVDDQEVESSRGREPMSYVHGQGEIIPGLEEQLEGMEPGQIKTAVVAPEKGYGQWSDQAVHEVPKSAFQDASQLEQGSVVSGQVQGQKFTATVKDIGDEHITLDMNHPLAGKTLEFAVEIVEVA